MPDSPTTAAADPSEAVRQPIWLCADDYGMAPGVNAAIRDLVDRGRLNATSVMVGAPSFDAASAAALAALNRDRWRVAIGLHVTLTTPYTPLTPGYRPLADGRFLSIGASLRTGLRRGFDPAALVAEVTAQIEAFGAAFGRPPDFIDGHQHVQLFPQVSEAVLAATRARAPGAWVRQCGRAAGALSWPALALRDRKGLLLEILSRRFRGLARAGGVATNPAFAGTYAFHDDVDVAALFPGFLADLPAGSVVMCHPGTVDDELRRLDPLTTLREREYRYLGGPAFPQVLAAHGLCLADRP